MNRVQHSRTCATPGCTRFLKARWPHDTCPACRGESDAPPARPARPGTRTVQVTYPATHSGVTPVSPVTLPIEPWSPQQ